MARKQLGLIHTSSGLVARFGDLCREYLSEVDVFHIADDSLVRKLMGCGGLNAAMSRRLIDHVAAAEDAGADVVMVTCSSVGAAVEMAAKIAGIPVLRVDQPMADRAVAGADRIGVLATLPTTLAPTTDLIQRRAQDAGKSVVVDARLCEGAFAALQRGDTQQHDQLIRDQIDSLAQKVQTIVLAQASMARVAEQWVEQPVPILSSPRIAMQHLATFFAS